MFEIGEEFLYKGDDTSHHGEVGKIIGIYPGVSPRKEYVCKVPWARSPLYLHARKMDTLFTNQSPTWEV